MCVEVTSREKIQLGIEMTANILLGEGFDLSSAKMKVC